MKRKLMGLMCLVWLIPNLNAQKTKSDGPDKNISRFLDNGKAKNCYNLIQFRAQPAVSGYLGLSYERKLTRYFSIEAGLYTKIGSKGAFEKNRINDNHPELLNYLSKYNGGAGFMIYPKLNIGRRSLNNVISYGFRIFKQYASAELRYPYPTSNALYKSQLQHSDYIFTLGNHRNIFSSFTLGFDIGFGLYKDTYKKVNTYDSDSNTVTSGDISIGNSMYYLDMSVGYLF